MKYPVVLKYNYSYVSSGNYYKTAEREYYQLFKEEEGFEMFAFGFTPTDKQLTIQSISENEIVCEHTFVIYAKAGTFSQDHEVITNSFVLKKGEMIESRCCETYWRYASGGENGPATLRVEWITYEQFLDECFENAKNDSDNAIRFASHLIKSEEYDTAFKLLNATGKNSSELALCYEMGYGTEIDLDRALAIYLDLNNAMATEGMERVLEKLEGRKIVFDNLERTVLLERLGRCKDAYFTAEIPRTLGEHASEILRRNVELTIVRFLTLGRPYNDPMRYPAPPTSHTTRYLAEYYDLINGVPENERKTYFKTWEERDEYEGDTNTVERFFVDAIVETLRAEAEKGDVIAQAVIAVQEWKTVADHKHFAELLLEKAERGEEKERAMAYYFLGLYHRDMAKNAEDTYKYDYTKGKTYSYTGSDIETDILKYAEKNGLEYKSRIALIYKLDSIESKLRWSIKGGAPEYTAEHQEVCNYMIYLYRTNYEEQSRVYEEHNAKAIACFKAALELGFHLAVAPIAKLILEEEPEHAYEILKAHEPYIPSIRDSFTDAYYKLLKSLEKND